MSTYVPLVDIFSPTDPTVNALGTGLMHINVSVFTVESGIILICRYHIIHIIIAHTYILYLILFSAAFINGLKVFN